jgi:6-pyruvoyltetrahydropterin/6-carboxytetrahydropterin synthase
MKTTCIKKYTDIPFAHRQPNHEGHCRLIHGHNWAFEFEFAAERKDPCGFVVDFGALGDLKAKLSELDHKLVLNESDPLFPLIAAQLTALNVPNVVTVEDCSCEGLAEWALGQANKIVAELTAGRAACVRCTVFEDSKNSATAYA